MKLNKLLLSLLVLPTVASAAIQVNVSPVTLFTTEDGTTVTYEMVLDEAPSAGENVTVTAASGDVTEGTVSGALNFTDANWDIPQAVTVTPGASGDGNDGDVMYTITNTTSAAGGTASFDGAPAAGVDVTNRNIDGVQTIVMNPASGAAFFLDEGSSQTVTISAVGVPTDDVEVDLVLASAEASISTSTVTLNAGNGFSATFDVTADIDMVVDADQAFTVVTNASVSIDGNYNGINLNDIDGIAVNVDVAAPAPATPVPTLGVLWQIALAGMLLIIGFVGMRRFA
ncbi:MAG: hypothetical protein AB8C02_03610 [Halioglobus sp.]